MAHDPDFSEWFTPEWDTGFAPGLGGGGAANWSDNNENSPENNPDFEEIWWGNMSSAWNTLGYSTLSELSDDFEDNMFTSFQDSQQWENYQENQTDQGENLEFVFDAFQEQNAQETERFARKIYRDKQIGEEKRAGIERERSFNTDIQSLTNNRIVNEAINAINQTYTQEGMYGFTNQTGNSTPLSKEMAIVQNKIDTANSTASIARGDLRSKRDSVNRQYGFSFTGEHVETDTSTGEFPWDTAGYSAWVNYDENDHPSGSGQYGIFNNMGLGVHQTGEQGGGSDQYWFDQGVSIGGEMWTGAGADLIGSTLSIGGDTPWGVGSAINQVLDNFEALGGDNLSNFVMGTDTVNALLQSANSTMNRAYDYGGKLSNWETQSNLDYANAYDSWLGEQYQIAGMAAGGSGG